MAWKKIDDDQALPDMPYSSFLANGLTVNANSYNDDMTRGGGIAWNATDRVTWSSYQPAQGVMFTVNIGQQVKDIEFRVTYGTLTGSVDADGFQGIVTIQHMGSGEFVNVGLLPTSGSLSYFDATLSLMNPTSGPQSFSLTFKSSKLANKGLVDVQGGVENTIYLDQNSSGGHYVLTQGEKHELLSLSEPGLGNTVLPIGPSTQSETQYQINYIHTGIPHPPDAFASVYPSVTSNPPRLNPSYSNAKISAATVFELGAITLYGIAYNVTNANTNNAPPQLSHNSAVPLAQVINIQNTARTQFQPDLCNGVSQRYALGAVVAAASTFPAASAVDTGFSFVCNATVDYLTLSVTMRVFTLNAGRAQKMSLSLLDDTGTLVVPKQDVFVLGNNSRLPQSVVGITARGWYDPTAVAAWGMRDSMTQAEMMDAGTVTFSLPNVYLLAGKVFTVKLEATPTNTAFYVFNLYARLTRSVG